MHIKAKREFHDDMGKVREGQILEVDDVKGADLIRIGLAENIQEAATSGALGPTTSDPIRSLTGTDAPLSSSLVAPAPETSTSNLPGEEPVSSSSTTDTVSAPGQTSSTPATANGGHRTRVRRGSRD